jgi:hypothetical protein
MDLGGQLYHIAQKKQIPWYAVFPRNDPNVRNMYLTYFKTRQIDATFFELMLELDKEFGFVPREFKLAQMS